MMTRNEILAVYAGGPEAVVRLVEALLARIEAQDRQIEQHAARIRELERRLGMDSHNSHKPPSSDGLSRGTRRPKSLRETGVRPTGGQVGHPGTTLRMVEEPDARQLHTPSACAHCAASLEAVEPSSCERRQVFDLPDLALFVTEHVAETKCCPRCHLPTSADFPAGVRQPVQYGPGVLSLSVYLQSYQLLPYARSVELLRDLFGASPSEGTLSRALRLASERLEPVEEEIRAAIQRAPVVHFDETGIREQARLSWLHVAGTEHLTYYRAHPKRGRVAMDAMGILEGFSGTAVHDAYVSYLTYSVHHALCNAHLLRELRALEEEQNPPIWAVAMSYLLRQTRQAVQETRASGAGALSRERLAALEADYQRILAQAERTESPPVPPLPLRRGRRKRTPARNLLERLQKHRAAVLCFAYDFRVPFDNNLAERDLRMAKVQQKISGGFRSAEGAAQFCRIRGYISTLRKQGTHVLSALQSVFEGYPLMPQLQG
jgi:transposase